MAEKSRFSSGAQGFISLHPSPGGPGKEEEIPPSTEKREPPTLICRSPPLLVYRGA